MSIATNIGVAENYLADAEVLRLLYSYYLIFSYYIVIS